MESTQRRWYTPDPSDPDDEKNRAALLIDECAKIEQRQSSWHELNLWNATLFSNRELIGFRWGAVAGSDEELWPTNLRTENLIEQIGEAMLSKASSSPLKPSLIPHGDSYKTERAVRQLDNFVFAVWRQTKAEDAAVQMFRDAFISGLGCVRVAFDANTKALHVEPVFFDNIVIDNRECADRAPPRTYRIRRVVPKASVEAQFDVVLDKQKRYVDYREVGDEYVVLVEVWRLPNSKGEGGRHTVAVCDKLIVDEEWKHRWVPLVFFHWKDRDSGFFTKSGVEQLIPYQIRQNELNDDIRAAQDLSARMRLLIRAGSEIDTSQWDSEHGRILAFTGEPPIDFKWSSNLEELYGERERNKAAAFSHMAISEAYANADMPQNVRMDSSAGIREARNMEDARHLRLWSRFEDARLQIARTILLVLSTEKGADAYSAVYHPARTKAAGQEIQWEAVKHLVDNQYSWRMEATPLSQMQPAARRELLRDWTSRGLITVGSEEAKRMEGNVNLDRVEELELASEDDVLRHMELLEEGNYEAPTEMTNLSKGAQMVTANYHRLKRYKDVDRKVLQNHVKWVTTAVAKQVEMLRKQSQPQEQPQVPFAPTQGMPGTNATTLPPPA